MPSLGILDTGLIGILEEILSGCPGRADLGRGRRGRRVEGRVLGRGACGGTTRLVVAGRKKKERKGQEEQSDGFFLISHFDTPIVINRSIISTGKGVFFQPRGKRIGKGYVSGLSLIEGKIVK